jgi:CHASE3 domain sensor protein
MKTGTMPANSKRNAGLEPIVAITLVGAFVFFLTSGVVAYRNLQTLRTDNAKIVHSSNVIFALDGLLSSAKDAETGQRGYLLTGNEDYLQPYNTAVAAIPSELNEIAQLTIDDPVQQGRMPALRQHVGTKLAELAKTIALRRGPGLAAALAVVNTNVGKNEMDNLRTAIAVMVQEETQLRDQRLAEMNQAYDTALTSSLLSGLLGVVLTGIIGFMIRRGALIRQREEWLQAGRAGMATAMLGNQNTEQRGHGRAGRAGLPARSGLWCAGGGRGGGAFRVEGRAAGPGRL